MGRLYFAIDVLIRQSFPEHGRARASFRTFSTFSRPRPGHVRKPSDGMEFVARNFLRCHSKTDKDSADVSTQVRSNRCRKAVRKDSVPNVLALIAGVAGGIRAFQNVRLGGYVRWKQDLRHRREDRDRPVQIYLAKVMSPWFSFTRYFVVLCLHNDLSSCIINSIPKRVM